MLNTGMGMKKGKEHNKRVSVYVEGVFVMQKWKMYNFAPTYQYKVNGLRVKILIPSFQDTINDA